MELHESIDDERIYHWSWQSENRTILFLCRLHNTIYILFYLIIHACDNCRLATIQYFRTCHKLLFGPTYCYAYGKEIFFKVNAMLSVKKKQKDFLKGLIKYEFSL